MPVRVDASRATEKWVNRLSGATQDIAAGVARVQEAPGQKAVRKVEKWQQNVVQARDKWVRNTGRVSLEEWRQAITDIGIPRIAQGAQQKRGKMESFMQEFLPHLQNGLNRIDNMPDTTMDQRINRAVEMMRHNHNFRRGGR